MMGYNKEKATSFDVAFLFLFFSRGLLTQSESLNDSAVALDVAILQVVEECTTLTYQLGQCSCCTIIFTVLFQVLRQVGNTV